MQKAEKKIPRYLCGSGGDGSGGDSISGDDSVGVVVAVKHVRKGVCDG